MKCDECDGFIDERSGFCVACGLEAKDFKERNFIRTVLSGSNAAGEQETRERKARKVRQYGRGYGHTCIICYELLKSSVRANADERILEYESNSRGYENPGTDVVRFNSRSELEEHINGVHGGRKEYWKIVNDKKLMSEIRRLDRLNNDMPVSTIQKGSGDKE